MIGYFDSYNQPKLDLYLLSKAEKIKIETLIDTGFSGELCLPKSLIKGADLKLIDTTLAEMANGELVEFNIYKAKILFDDQIKEVAVFDTKSEEALIGTGLLADKSLTIDFVNRRITVSGIKKKK